MNGFYGRGREIPVFFLCLEGSEVPSLEEDLVVGKLGVMGFGQVLTTPRLHMDESCIHRK